MTMRRRGRSSLEIEALSHSQYRDNEDIKKKAANIIGYRLTLVFSFLLILMIFIIIFSMSSMLPMSSMLSMSSCPDLHRDARRALSRASSEQCKKTLREIACLNQQQQLYPKQLINKCPRSIDVELKGRQLGCFVDSFKQRLLPDRKTLLSDGSKNKIESCIDLCTASRALFAGLQYGKECFCGSQQPEKSNLADDRLNRQCNMSCNDGTENTCGGYLAMQVYHTGISKEQTGHSRVLSDDYNNNDVMEEDDKKLPARVAFLLTVSGRGVHQVLRLLKNIYRTEHLYLIHVDARHDYMYQELKSLEDRYPNIRLAERRFATIWGGASLLQMLLSCFQSLLNWSSDFDFVINLSESDFPLRSMEELGVFLGRRRGLNFVRSHGRDTETFIRKQGLERTFYECDHHLWRLGPRSLPQGIHVDGGSDWFCLTRAFVNFLVNNEDDQDLKGLKSLYAYTLLPAESFFHVALRNSQSFCHSMVNSNLHMTNWKRKLGCQCQHKHVVDWCGCSPNVYKMDDLRRIMDTKANRSDVFFGRKFDHTIDAQVINIIEGHINDHKHQYNKSSSGYWQNLFISWEGNPNTVLVTLANTLVSLALRSMPSMKDEKQVRVKEVTSYHVKGSVDSILVLFELPNNDLIELRARPKMFNTQTHLEEDGRLLSVSVGGDYDVKEQMFRNYGNAFGPEAKISARVQLQAANTIEKNAQFNLTLVWFDSTASVVDKSIMAINASALDKSVQLNSIGKLKEGPWSLIVLIDPQDNAGNTSVRVMDKVTVLTQIQFPVLFLTLKDSNTEAETENAEETELSEVEKKRREQLNLNYTPFAHTVITEELKDQSTWTWESIKSLFDILEMCQLPKGNKFRDSMTKCEGTPWSSRRQYLRFTF